MTLSLNLKRKCGLPSLGIHLWGSLFWDIHRGRHFPHQRVVAPPGDDIDFAGVHLTREIANHVEEMIFEEMMDWQPRHRTGFPLISGGRWIWSRCREACRRPLAANIMIIMMIMIAMIMMIVLMTAGTCFELTGGGGETSHWVTLTGIIWKQRQRSSFLIKFTNTLEPFWLLVKQGQNKRMTKNLTCTNSKTSFDLKPLP